MPERSALRLAELNSLLACNICGGYLIDATTIIECLHSFCRTCIVQYLESSNFCPACNVQVHKTRPLLSIRSDQTLQDLVYKLVPGLYQNEMQKRREFYGEHPEAASSCSPEERGECDPRFIFPKENISVVLYHSKLQEEDIKSDDKVKDPTTRYLNCPAGFTVGHLKKFLQLKFSLPGILQINIFYEKHMLRDEFTLIDVAYIYSWKRADPMYFSYCVSKRIPEPQAHPSAQTLCSKPEQSTEIEQPPEDSSLKECKPLPGGLDSDHKLNETPVNALGKPDAVELEKSEPCSVGSKEVSEPSCAASPKSSTSSSLFLPLPEPTYNSVKLISAPEKSTLLSPTNGFRLKFIKNPELNPKSQKLKKSGKKSSKNSEHKYARVKLARLAPYPPPAVPVPCLTPQITVGKLVPTVITTLSPTVTSSFVSNTPRSLYNSSQGSSHSKVAFVNQSITNNSVTSVSHMPGISNTSTLSVPSFSTSLSSISCQSHPKDNKEVGSLIPSNESQSPNIQPPPAERVGISECRVLVSDVSKMQDSSLLCASPAVKASEDVQQSSCDPNVSQLIPAMETAPRCTTVTAKQQHSDLSTEHQKVDSMGSKPLSQQYVKPKPEESFETSVRNSISAEFSDSEDLGYPRDLVVDEQRVDSSDNEDEADKALRKKITAIAEHEEEMETTDDTEADSGVSCATKSEDDTDSIRVSEENYQNATATTTAVTSPTSSSVSENHRQVKSNNINDVIKNLYRQHEKSRPSSPVPQCKPGPQDLEKKVELGALDLSTCSKKTSECSTSRPRPVANPVLDIKHRQQTYLPAPLKQHTACPPAPKHSSSPLLLHHLTNSSSILHNQLTSHSPPISSPFRPPSSPTPLLPSSFHPTLSPEGPKPGHSLLPGMMQYASLVNLAYSSRNSMSMGLSRASPFPKDVSSLAKKQSSARKPVDSLACRTSKSKLSVSSSPYPKPSPFMSLHPSPASSASPSTSVSAPQSKLSAPAHKKGQPSYKNFKFKGGNLAVYNPDPSGHRPKLVIKNLNPCPNDC